MTNLPTMTTGGLPEDSPANAISQPVVDITPDPAKMDEIVGRIRAECEQDDAVRHLVEFIEKSERGVARG